MQNVVATIREEKSGYKPSLLRQIVDETDSLNTEEQLTLLRRLRLEKLGTKFKVLDEKLKENEIKLTEEGIADMISNEQKKRFEEKVRSLQFGLSYLCILQ